MNESITRTTTHFSPAASLACTGYLDHPFKIEGVL